MSVRVLLIFFTSCRHGGTQCIKKNKRFVHSFIHSSETLSLTSWSNARNWSNTQPSSKGVKDCTFLKNRRQRSWVYRDLCRSLTITISRDRLLHFLWEKTSLPIFQLFQRSKVVSVNLPILPFLKLKILKFCKCWCPPLLLAVGGVTCVYLSVRNCPGAGEGWGVGEELPVLIENFMEHVSWTVSHAQTEI